jgi:ferredoxin--NADP+ reductase
VKYPDQVTVPPRLTFRFLTSPQAIHAGPDGRINRLTVVENLLVPRNGGTAAKATDKTTELDVDTMIFAIGDVADPSVGLPYSSGAYVTNPDTGDPKRAAYEVFDPQSGKVVPATYVVGWARKASEGLVGIARHDGEVGAEVVLRYLEGAPSQAAAAPEEILGRLRGRGLQPVSKEDLALLARAEEKQARERGLSYFKFDDDRTMLEQIEEEKSHNSKPAAVVS